MTGWTLATPSLTTKTKLPLWLRCTATVGTTMESSLRMISLVATRVPGHKVSFLLSMMPRTVTMPVVASTVFSTIATLPVSERWWPGMVAVTLERPAAIDLAQIDQHALRNREGDIDRRHLVDDGERRRIRRAHEIADLHIGHADPAGKRRADHGVALLDLQIVERSLIGLDGAGQDVGLRPGIIDIDLRGGALGDEIGEATEIALRALELRLIPGQHPLGLFDLGVDLAAVEREQQIAFVDLGAVLEMHRDDRGFQP